MLCRLAKIGTFSPVGRRGGGWGTQGRAPFRSASPGPASLVPFLPGQERNISVSSLQNPIPFRKQQGMLLSCCRTKKAQYRVLCRSLRYRKASLLVMPAEGPASVDVCCKLLEIVRGTPTGISCIIAGKEGVL